MSDLPARRFLVLHALRLKGVAGVPEVTTATGLDDAEVGSTVTELVADGLVERREGSLPGWTATALGRKQDGVQVAEELETTGSRAGIQVAYDGFLAVNPELLAACAAWQLLSGEGDGAPVINDHSDPDYDAEVVARLVETDRLAQPVLEALAATLARFAPYRPRLALALARVQAGDGDWFTRPVIGSYHSVWFELHQDLLDTLGLERGA